VTPAVAEHLLPQLLRVFRREETLRLQLWSAGASLCLLLLAKRATPTQSSNSTYLLLFCTPIALVLYWYCTPIALVLYWYSTPIALLLHWYSTRTQLVLHSYCTGTPQACTGRAASAPPARIQRLEAAMTRCVLFAGTVGLQSTHSSDSSVT
jgi:hypothetical protein